MTKEKDQEIIRGATFSPCRRYRYKLWRRWGDSDRYAMFIGLNPSTADEFQDDPTIRRCINYSKAWGYDAFMMTNLFGWRATDPKDMIAVDDPVGSMNNHWIMDAAKSAGVVVAAWGVHGKHLGRGDYIRTQIPNLKCLVLTKEGYPGHPLYLKKSLVPIDY